MGIFVLNNSDSEEIDINSLKELGKKKGLHIYCNHKIGKYNLHLLRNELKKNNSYTENEFSIYSFGSFIYKDNISVNALKLYLHDYTNNEVDENFIYGSFILILVKENAIKIIREKSQISKVFKTTGKSVYSNSFLSLVFPIKKKWSLNVQSIKENVLLGYILSPKTIVDEIQEVSFDINENNILFKNFSKIDFNSKKQYTSKLLKQKIISLLENQYKSISEAFKNENVDIGLSGGYDSRLNLAIAKEVFPIKPHSHYKERKDQDLDIANKLCDKLNIELKTKRIRPAIAISNEIDLKNLIDDSFYYYDGRVALNTGFFNEIYTRKYRKFILKETKLTLTGFGGETFRNYDFQPSGKLEIDKWLENFVFSYYNFTAMSKTKENKAFLKNVRKSISSKINIKNTDNISFENRRKYFNEVWLPMTYSIKSFSENQLSYFISPFINYQIKLLSPQLSKALSNDWNFQAKLIDEIDPMLSNIESSYGYSFNQTPFFYGVKNKFKNLKYIIPLKNSFQKYNFKRNVTVNRLETKKILDEIFDEILEYIKGVDVNYIKSSINWYYNVLSIALIIKRIKEHNESI